MRGRAEPEIHRERLALEHLVGQPAQQEQRQHGERKTQEAREPEQRRLGRGRWGVWVPLGGKRPPETHVNDVLGGCAGAPRTRNQSSGACRPDRSMPEARVELARGCPRWILSPLRLPFRHSGLRYLRRDGADRKPRRRATRGARRPPILRPRPGDRAPHLTPREPARRAQRPAAQLPPLARHPDRPRIRPTEVTAVIEIPTNERNKYELDKELGVFRLDRVLHSAVHYPGDYGFLPRTLGDDGDPLDVLVLMTIPVFTGCLVDARPIGLFHLVDRGVADEKVLAVPTGDPYSDGLNDLGDIPPHYLKEIEHFFQVYKDLEGTRTETRGFEGAGGAREGDR